MPIQVAGSPRRGRPNRPIRASGVGGSVRQARQLYAELQKLVGPMVDDLMNMVPWLESRPGPAAAAYALQSNKEKWRRVLGPSIRGIAGRWVHAVSERDRLKLKASLAKALGVHFVSI